MDQSNEDEEKHSNDVDVNEQHVNKRRKTTTSLVTEHLLTENNLSLFKKHLSHTAPCAGGEFQDSVDDDEHEINELDDTNSLSFFTWKRLFL